MSPEADFGNDQDMSVHDKMHPTLGPTEEAQDVASLERIVVPMPAFTDPNNPAAAAGTINLSLNDHPVTHSEDYGQEIHQSVGSVEVQNPLSDALREHGDEMGGGEPIDYNRAAGSVAAQGLPEDRGEWTKANWQSYAKSQGLHTSGNKDALQSRVEDYERDQEERGNYDREVRDLSRDDLDQVARERDIDPEQYSTKELLAEAVVAAEFGDEVPAGDKASDTNEEQ